MRKFSVLKCDVYPYNILLCIGASKEQILREIKRTYGCSASSDFAERLSLENKKGLTLYDLGEKICVLWVSRLAFDPSSISTLSHEVFHVVYAVMSQVDIQLSRESEEAFSYLHEHLMNQALIAIWNGKRTAFKSTLNAKDGD